eukprot:746474-Hanusia_phi.AAC.6
MNADQEQNRAPASATKSVGKSKEGFDRKRLDVLVWLGDISSPCTGDMLEHAKGISLLVITHRKVRVTVKKFYYTCLSARKVRDLSWQGDDSA